MFFNTGRQGWAIRLCAYYCKPLQPIVAAPIYIPESKFLLIVFKQEQELKKVLHSARSMRRSRTASTPYSASTHMMGPAGQTPSQLGPLETIEDTSLLHTRDPLMSGDSEPLPPPPDMPRRPAATSAGGAEAAAARASGRGHRLSRLRVGSASPSGDESGGGGAPSCGAYSGAGDQRVLAGSSSPALPSDAAATPWQPWSPEEAERALSMAASSVGGAVFRMSESQVNFDGGVPISGGGSSGGGPRRPIQGHADRDPAACGAEVLRQYNGMPGPLGEAFEEWEDSGGSSSLPQTPRDAVSSPSVAAGASFVGRGDKSVRKMSQYRSRGMTVSQRQCYTNA